MMNEFQAACGEPDRVNLAVVACVLRDRMRCIDWDDAWDTLDEIDASYGDQLLVVYDLAQDLQADYTARSYAVRCIARIAPCTETSLHVLAALLKDGDAMLRSEAAEVLSDCPEVKDSPFVIAALAEAAKDWRSTVGAQAAAFKTLMGRVGLREAIRDLREIPPEQGGRHSG